MVKFENAIYRCGAGVMKITKAQQRILTLLDHGVLEFNMRTGCAYIKLLDGGVIDIDRRPFDRLCAMGILVNKGNIAGSSHRKVFAVLK